MSCITTLSLVHLHCIRVYNQVCCCCSVLHAGIMTRAISWEPKTFKTRQETHPTDTFPKHWTFDMDQYESTHPRNPSILGPHKHPLSSSSSYPCLHAHPNAGRHAIALISLQAQPHLGGKPVCFDKLPAPINHLYVQIPPCKKGQKGQRPHSQPAQSTMQLVYLHAQHEQSIVYHISPPVVYDLSTQSFMTIILMILTIFVSTIKAYASNIDKHCAMASSTISNRVGK